MSPAQFAELGKIYGKIHPDDIRPFGEVSDLHTVMRDLDPLPSDVNFLPTMDPSFHGRKKAALDWIGRVVKMHPKKAWDIVQHGRFNYGEFITELPEFQDVEKLSKRSRRVTPRPALPDLRDKSVAETIDIVSRWAPALNVQHGVGRLSNEEMYTNLQKAVFFEKIFHDKHIEHAGELTKLELETIRLAYNNQFKEMVLDYSRLGTLINDHSDRRMLPTQEIPFTKTAEEWARNVEAAHSDTHDAWDMLKHGILHYG